MKRLTYRCRTLRFFSNSFTRIMAIPLVVVLTQLLAGYSCTTAKNESVSDGSSDAKPQEDEHHEVYLIESADTASPVYWGKVAGKNCDQQEPMSLALTLGTSVGDVPAKIYFGGDRPLSMQIQQDVFRGYAEPNQDQNLNVNHTKNDEHVTPVARLPFSQSTNETICSALHEKQANISLSSADELAIQRIISTFVPSCSAARPTSLGIWQCPGPHKSAATLAKELAQLHQQFLAKYRRHSYSFARKVTTAKQLASALISNEVEGQLNQFCQIISYAMQQELTLVLNSTSWRDAVCQNKKQRQKAALHGLEESYHELRALMDFMKDSAHGNIQLKLPANEQESSEVLITLTLNPASTTWSIARDAPLHCWHPLYSGTNRMVSRKNLATAQVLGIINPMASGYSPCNSSEINPEDMASLNQSIHEYVFTNVSTETAFSMPNRHNKTVRLPYGDYKYELKHVPKGLSELKSPSQPISQGTIEWSSRNSSHTIRTW